jgi:tripartite-type tricarboxylate transporter receptor subunit TctC
MRKLAKDSCQTVSRRKFLATTAVGTGGLLAGCTGGGGGEYPNETIRFIIPFDTGGGVDFWARGVFPTIADNLGVDVEFENISGGGGTRGFAELANSEADGYTLASDSQGYAEIAHLTNDTDHEWTEFETGGVITEATREIIFADPELELTGWDDLFERYESGELENFGAGDNTGSLSATFAQLQNDGTLPESASRVGYGGSGPAVEAVVTGEVPAGIATDTSAAGAGFVDELDVLGTVTEDASQVVPAEDHLNPDVVSLAQAGYPAYQRLGQYNYGYYWPEGTPQDRIETVAAAVQEAVQDPELQEWAEEAGNVLGPYRSPSEHETIRDETWQVFRDEVDVSGLEDL